MNIKCNCKNKAGYNDCEDFCVRDEYCYHIEDLQGLDGDLIQRYFNHLNSKIETLEKKIDILMSR